MDDFKFCFYCATDCTDGSEHGPGCPTVTGLYPVTRKYLQPYGMICMDCNTPFEVGDFYTLRRIKTNIAEVVCIGCRILNPEAVGV